MPAPGGVLFVGSSSVRMWGTLAADMAPARVLNRGFGGSKTPEVLAEMDRVVFPYRPAVIVYYCGDNDLGTDNTDSWAAANGFVEFAERVRARQPGTTILYMSIKPSVARWNNWPAMQRANLIVEAYCDSTEGVEFVDLGSCLLGAGGTPEPALFEADGLHLNAAGYRLWTERLRPRVMEAAGLEG
jgi:lysophospholipase L1-like esterase